MPEMKEVLRQLRTSSGYSQAELGNMMGVAKSTISMYERGERSPDNEMLEKYSNIFGVDYNYLHGFEPIEKTPLLREFVIYHRDGKNRKVKFTPEQLKIFQALVDSANSQDIDK